MGEGSDRRIVEHQGRVEQLHLPACRRSRLRSDPSRRAALRAEPASYHSFASFHDPDGNGWLLQEVTTRAPGRIETETTFASVDDLAGALRRAGAAHGKHEERTGGQYDENWPEWYAEYIVREQSGEELPQ